MGDAWTGARTDVTHDVWAGGTGDAQTGAMTDVTHDVWTGGTDNPWTGAMTDGSYNVLMVGDFTRFFVQVIYHGFLPIITGDFR